MSCENREATYVPWTMGEMFKCTSCGRTIRQSHDTKRLRGEDYAAIYPIPAHEADPKGQS